MTPEPAAVAAAAVPAVVLLIGGLPPALAGLLRGRPADRLAGLLAAGPLTALATALLAAAYGRPTYLDVALVLALLASAGSLVFARFLARTL
ncbi:monovalent cation/H+ antiporter complex subunit F [Actinomadura sp. LOL_016]|uniref:monovalent cation/H+ antiporter complex subunit F n=1 Tax=unclassified Actinomadura TaxID=2626254 RepID=UPI003A810E73